MHLLRSRPGPCADGRCRRHAALPVAVALLAIALGTAPAARAELVINDPVNGSFTKETEPLFEGTVLPMPEEFCNVEVLLYAGESASGVAPLQTLVQPFGGCSWLAGPAATLEQGTYTAVAHATRYIEGEEQVEAPSAPVTFTVDTTAPTPTISSPVPGTSTTTSSLAVSGSSAMTHGDLPTVNVQVFAGAIAEGVPVEAIEAPVTNGAWSGTLAGLAPGSYTLRAQQADSAGNLGLSQPVGLQVMAPAPPSASFTWFPTSPQVGESVSLVSSSTDPESPLTGFAWALSGSAPFAAGTPTLTMSFATPGPHVVRLQVTDAAGRSRQAAQTITVRHHEATLMEPFPIVRIAGRETRAGARLSLLTVTAPISSRVTVRLRRKGSRPDSLSRVATAGVSAGSSTALLTFRHFARAIPAGAVLEVRITKSGQIGKLMRFVPHRGRLPTRTDACLSTGGTPVRCPAT
jgi:hypothetical protein